MIGNNHRAGFTLIELLVVTAVFSIIFLVGTTAFTNIQAYQRGILARQRVAADGRYVLESLARSVRLGSIDYTYYDANTMSTNPNYVPRELAVRNSDNSSTCYYLANQKLFQSAVSGSNCTGGTQLTPDDLQVLNFGLRIIPKSNPYRPVPTAAGDCRAGNYDVNGVCTCTTVGTDNSSCYLDQRCVATDVTPPPTVCKNAVTQPEVTITLHTRSTNTGPGEQADITLQTTATSRIYAQ